MRNYNSQQQDPPIERSSLVDYASNSKQQQNPSLEEVAVNNATTFQSTYQKNYQQL